MSGATRGVSVEPACGNHRGAAVKRITTYPVRTTSSAAPSAREIREPVSMIGSSAIASRIISGASSHSTCSFTVGGLMSEVTPRMHAMLKMLEPRMLPTAISACLRTAAMTEVASSGIEVPPATIVSAIASSETPSDRAMPDAESIRSFEAPVRISRPTATSDRLKSVLWRKRFAGGASGVGRSVMFRSGSDPATSSRVFGSRLP